jgi:hypothetical protein
MFSFIETRLFTKLVLDYLSDEDYAALQAVLMQDPESGPVIPGSGGVRKLRWAARAGSATSNQEMNASNHRLERP